MKTEGHYLEYRGTTYPESFYGKDWVAVPLGESSEDAFPDAIEFGDSGKGPWVKLPKVAATRRWSETVHAVWRGAEVTVISEVSPSEVMLYFVGSPKVAEELGMDGSQFDGWTVRAPVAEVKVVDVEVREY